jgi:TP901 family phage tail tape measure protein
MATNELKVLLTGDASRLSASLNTASGKLKSFGSNVKNIGASLQRVAVPLALAGGAAIKLGVDFDKSMTQIKSLVGVASAEVDKMGVAAKKMAVDTGISSKDAAEALFFITSAGLRGSDAMDVLNASLKASAVGLGETKVVADLATSAMNAYGSKVLSATGATDVLVSAVREGKLEASELSAAMGSVLPIASNMGVKFHEVGAAFAALSRTGTGASEAATQIRGILSSLLKPTTQAEAALTQMKLSSAGLRKSLKEDGLLATLEILKKNFEGNDTAAQTVFGNVRALSGVMDLLGAGVESTRTIFDNMTKTQGATAKAFEATSESASFKLQKSLNELRVAFTELGGELLKTFLPYIKSAASALMNLFKGFQNLSPTAKKAIIILGGIVTVLGPALIVVGQLITAFGSLASAISFVGSSSVVGNLIKGMKSLNITMLANPYVAIAAGIIAVGTAFVTAANKIAPSLSTFEQAQAALKGFMQGGAAGVSSGLAIAEAAALSAKKAQSGAALSPGVATTGPNLPGQGQAASSTFGLGLLAPNQEPIIKETTKAVENLTPKVAKLKTQMMGLAQLPIAEPVAETFNEIAKSTDNLKMAFEVNFASIATTMGQALATAIVDGKNLMGALSGAILGALGGLLKQMGEAAIAASALAKTFAIPGIGAAAGVAAIVLGTVLTGLATKVQSGGFSAFANGGIVSGPTMGLVGEYPGAKSNPEVIAPLNKLKNIIGEQNGGGNMNVSGEFVVRGQDLVVALQRADKTRSRIK